MRRPLGLLALPALALALGACGSSGSGVKQPKIAAARTFALAGFTPTAVHGGDAATVSFRIDKPSGAAMTPAAYKRGSGPHTGIHLIIVRDDLTGIIHRHPPIGADGRVSARVRFPGPGRYRVLVDAYPALRGAPVNFQLFRNITVGGGGAAKALPPFRRSVKTHGYTLTMTKLPKLKAITAGTLEFSVTRPDGSPATFQPWYGALAHAIFFRARSLDYFHTHVCGAGAPNCTARLGAARVVGRPTSPGHLRVGVLLPVPGTWRLFLQCHLDGKVITAPFTLKVS